MQTQQTLESLNITIPEKRGEALSFFKGILSLAPKITIEESLAIAKAMKEKFPKDKEVLGCASLLEMSSFYFRNKYTEATLAGNEALEIFQSIQNKEGEGSANIILGGCYRSLGDNDKALYYIQKGILHIPEASYYNRFLIIGYYQGAEIFYLFNKLEESLNYFNKALSLPEIDIWLKGRMLNGIGNVFLKQKKYTEAIQLLQEAYNLVKDEGNKLLNARLLSDMGSYYYEVKDYDIALEYENKS
jgi:adenylate cyclase